MSFDMAKKEYKMVFRICLSYYDFEEQKKVEREDYVKDYASMMSYLKDFQDELVWVDSQYHQCREQIQIKIKQDFIPVRKYFNLFDIAASKS